MNKELQDLAWSLLPKEFKEEVKRIWSVEVDCANKYKSEMHKNRTDLLYELFGEHLHWQNNLTSDAEGEEMLMVEKRKVQDVYKTSHEIVSNEVYGSKMYSMHLQILCVLEALFGSKCLPDVPSSDAHEDNFATKEPKPAEPEEPTCTDTCTDDCPSQSRNLSQETANCDKCNDLRPHIAAMMAQAILTRIDDIPQVIAEAAFRHADSLIAESKKRRSDGNL